MNPANGAASSAVIPGQSSWGNAFPMFGTGNVIYAQFGYLLSKMGEQGQLQPYASLIHANYQRLNDPMSVFDLGINWLIKGHNSKFFPDYQNRPVY